MNFRTMNFRITKEEAQEWANALRSGKYKQTTGSLQDKTGYCCLGVGCDLFIPKDRQKMDERNLLIGEMPTLDNQPFAPWWLTEICTDMYLRLGVSFSAMNDNYGYTFDMIADLIELVYVHKALD